jgi:hypothetical protein
MKRLLLKIRLISIIVVTVVASLSFLAQAAEKQKYSGAGKVKQVLSRTTISPGDVPNHELAQEVRIITFTFTSNKLPDWEDAWDEPQFDQSDGIAGSGSHRGYGISRLKSGDETYGKWEGTHKTTVKEGGAWETTFEGKWWFTGGTGKVKNLKGGGIYKGKATVEGSTWTWEGEWEY